MPAATLQLLADLDDSGAFSTDLTAYWERDDGFDQPAIGRDEDLGLAGMGRFSLRLDNRDGRFSSKNTGSPYYPNWTPYKLCRGKITFNAVTYDLFYGLITGLAVDPEPDGQACHLQVSDLMYVLARTDITCPLMRGFSGPIVNRLIDRAELGERVTNPSVEEDTTGYSALGGGGIGRATVTRPVLEGPASLAVSAGAADDGVRYTMTGENGDKDTVVAYVQARDDNNEGSVYIQMADTVGTVATGANTAVKAGRWTRLSVSGTYNGGSSSQYLQVRRSASGGSPDFVVGAIHATPAVAAIARAVDEGQSWFDAFTFPRGKALTAVQKVTENELGALFYFGGDGTAIFEDRHHRWKGDHLTSQGTFDERGRASYEQAAEDRIKEVALDFPRYLDGLAGTQLWSLDRVPVAFAPNGSLSFEVDYGGGLASGVIKPVAGTDYIVRTQPDNSGSEASANVLVTTWHDKGGSAEITLTNQIATPLFLIFLRVRGTPLREASDRTPARFTASGGPAHAAVLSHRYDLNSRETAVQAWAEYLGLRYSVQQDRIRLSLGTPFPEAAVATTDMVQILSRKVSDRVTWINDTLPFSTKINAAFYIDRLSRKFTGESIECDWELAPIDDDYWILGTDRLETSNESRVGP
jgi:hypothetical protein